MKRAVCLAAVVVCVAAHAVEPEINMGDSMSEETHGERQLTHDLTRNAALDNNLNFSPDGKWLVFDTRDQDLTECRSIEKVNVETGERVVLYAAPNPVPGQGPGVAASSYFPYEDAVIFIHGPMTETGLSYAMTRRTGAMVPGDGSGVVTWADARDVTPPFTPGALRGGTHRHEPGGPDGRWIGYTYNDQIMKGYSEEAGIDWDLRTLGVTMLGHPVAVDETPENVSGAGFSVVVVEVTPKEVLDENPGTDRIFRASNDRWVGTRGYQKPDGSWQIARAFLGMTRVYAEDGQIVDHSDVYIVDIPDDITVPGDSGPLEGTATSFPAPPAGTVQRRLTRTTYGCRGDVRSSPDGSRLAFLSRTEDGAPQIFTVSPLGGEMTQVTFFPEGVRSEPMWFPDGRHILTVHDRCLVVVDGLEPGPDAEVRYFTERGNGRIVAKCISPDGKLVAFNRTIGTREDWTMQVFVVDVE